MQHNKKHMDTRASQPGYEAWLLYFVILGKFSPFFSRL